MSSKNKETYIYDDEWNLTKDTIIAIISRIQERYESVKIEGDDEFNQGRKLAYFEMLDMIKNDLEARGFEVDEFLK